MAVIVDLGELPYYMAIPVIEWCLTNNIDTEKCVSLLETWTTIPCPKDVDWKITMSEKDATMFVLKFI